jgi:hypothetical protein
MGQSNVWFESCFRKIIAGLVKSVLNVHLLHRSSSRSLPHLNMPGLANTNITEAKRIIIESNHTSYIQYYGRWSKGNPSGGRFNTTYSTTSEGAGFIIEFTGNILSHLPEFLPDRNILRFR